MKFSGEYRDNSRVGLKSSYTRRQFIPTREYPPASFLFIETLKLTFKVYLTQATSHGCHNLHDQIRIPRRLPRTRRSTTRKPRRRKSKKRRTTPATEYHCRKKLLVDSCGTWNHSFVLLNRTICYQAFQYIHCLTPLKMKCQNMFASNGEISEVQTFLHKCYQTFLKSSKSHNECLTCNISLLLLGLVHQIFHL